MKFNSILKLSMHNLYNNKLRTTLTVIVLLIMAIVVMLMASFGISFYSSMNKNFSAEFKKEGSSVYIDNSKLYQEPNSPNSNLRTTSMSIDMLKSTLEKLDSKDSLLTYITLEGNGEYIELYANGKKTNVETVPFYAKSNPFFEKTNYLEQGRMWNKTDDGATNIWLDKNFLNDGIRLGDEVSINYIPTTKFKVCGFLNANDGNSYGYKKVYIDYNYFVGAEKEYDYSQNGGSSDTSPTPNMYVKYVRCKLLAQDGIEYGNAEINSLRKLSKSINTYSPKSGGVRFACDILENMKMANYILLAIIVVILFLGVIIILLSIGSVSNTIKITVEQNRKFFGMMKAIGMQDKTVRNIVQWQALVMVLFSVIIASFVVLGLMVAMKGIISSLIVSLFGSKAIVVCSLNAAIPFITAFMLVAAVLLSTRKSLNRISKMDVISVISEVN